MRKWFMMVVLFLVSNAWAQEWSQIGADIDGEAAGDRSGRSVSLSADGTRVAIGAYLNEDNGWYSGQVRIFEYAGGSWTQLGADLDGEAAYDRSGESVSLSADGARVAIGAPRNDGNGSESGQVRIFEYAAGSWTQLGADLDGEAASDYSGYSVSLSADGARVAIGATANDGNGSSSGQVRIFEYAGGSWTQLGADLDGEAVGDVSGCSVSLSADGARVAIGAPYNDGNGSNSGQVRIFEYAGGSWAQIGADLDGEAAGDRSGISVSLSADGARVAIGAYLNDGNGSESGQVRIFYEAPSYLSIIVNGHGSVSPPNGGYEAGTNLVLTASPDTHWLFLGWSGDITGGPATATTNITLNSNLSVTANFGLLPVLNMAGFYESQSGAAIVIDATPTNGYPAAYTYQWYVNGFSIPAAFGGTNQTRFIDGSSGNNGTWKVKVTNGAGITSHSFEYRVFTDADSDGLSDYREIHITFTDPNDTDSDDDGLNDYVEVNTHLTDPNDSDTDDDGLSDYAEVNTHATNPNLGDSDGDTLSDYAEVNTYGTNPNNSDSDGDGLDDAAEINTYSTNPNSADSDGDTLSDYAEVNTYGTNPNNSDSDGDGIYDATEINTYSSNPNSSDSDGDGFDDGAEVNGGLNPNSSDAWIISYITNHPATFSLGTGGGYTLDEIRDLRPGSTLFGVSNSQATLFIYIDQSTNLTTSWETTTNTLEATLPVDSNTKFLRFRMN